MPGLIPLMLGAGSRQSASFAPKHQPTRSTTVVLPTSPDSSTNPQQPRRAVLQRLSSPPILSPGHAPAAAPRFTRRFTYQPATAPAPAFTVPSTHAEWAKAVSEVKRLYLHRRFRPCSVRCTSILDSAKDVSDIEPAYLIYLHFYAAISMEMSARPLHDTSAHRTSLLRQAETHYNRAAELIQAENDTMRRFSRASTASSYNPHSPSDSVSSRASTTSTRLSSPTPSVRGIDEKPPATTTTTAKKRVTFSDMAEPIVRPDSPTLGFDDFEPPSAPEPKPMPILVNTTFAQQQQPPLVQEFESPAEGDKPFHFRFSGIFFRETSVDRYCSILASLRSQVMIHLASVRDELARPASAEGISGRSTPESLIGAAAGDEAEDEARMLEMRVRIERLRQNGWRRRRFDPTRYEVLRESVLAELE